MTIQKQRLSFQLGKAPAGEADARLTISTSHEDREGDVLVPEGAVLDAYKRNPVVLFSHDHYTIPVARTVAINVVPGQGIKADFVWLRNDEQADRVRNAYEQGVLNAASVGFRPLAYEPIKSGYRYTSWELLEWSICPVPANPNATRLLKSLGWGPQSSPRLATLDQLISEIRSGGSLTLYQQQRLDEAHERLVEVMTNAQPEEVAVVFDREVERPEPPFRLVASEEEIRAAVVEAISTEFNRVTGRVD